MEFEGGTSLQNTYLSPQLASEMNGVRNFDDGVRRLAQWRGRTRERHNITSRARSTAGVARSRVVGLMCSGGGGDLSKDGHSNAVLARPAFRALKRLHGLLGDKDLGPRPLTCACGHLALGAGGLLRGQAQRMAHAVWFNSSGLFPTMRLVCSTTLARPPRRFWGDGSVGGRSLAGRPHAGHVALSNRPAEYLGAWHEKQKMQDWYLQGSCSGLMIVAGGG